MWHAAARQPTRKRKAFGGTHGCRIPLAGSYRLAARPRGDASGPRVIASDVSDPVMTSILPLSNELPCM
jgi:hypothetical protein